MMDLPSARSMMLPILRRAAKREIVFKQMLAQIAKEFKLSDLEMRIAIASGARVVNNRLSRALANLHKAGLLDRPGKGVYTITDRGKEILSANPPEITPKMLRE